MSGSAEAAAGAPAVDAAARERIRTSLDESLLVEAAAGTGKTSELVRRLVAVIADGRLSASRGGRGMSGLVAVTFTRKAAGELELRLRQELERERAAAVAEGRDRERRHFEEAIRRLEEAHIGTIHSFCAELLRERPVEAGVDPAFEGVSDEQGPRLFAQAFHGWIQETLQQMPEGVRRALVRLASRPPFGGLSPLDRLMQAGQALAEWRDHDAAWRRPKVDLRAEIDALVLQVGDLAELARRCSDTRDGLRIAIDPAEALQGWVERVEEVAPRDYDELEARLVDLAPALRRRWVKGRGRFAEGVSRAEVIERRDALIQRLERFRDLADADLAALLRGELQGLLERYDEIKRRGGRLDFTDLLLRTRDLLCRDAGARRFFQERFTHIFIDEFQDTDPLQTEILLLLAADSPDQDDWREVAPVPGKLFLVGDPKQSIYRFRRADVVLYQEVKRKLEARGVGTVRLEQSFRAVAPIQAAINHAFAAQMVEDDQRGQAGYIALQPARAAASGQPALVALPVSRPHGIYQVSRVQVEASLPGDVVAFVDWLLLHSGWTVADPRSGERRGLVPDDVCILFRRYQSWLRDVTRDYTRGLEARGIPHVLVGARSFHQREEVETLRSALTAVEWPDDTLSVFATLRGSLFAIDDEMLLRFHRIFRHLHPFDRRLEQAGPAERERFAPVFEALELLARLHRGRNRRPVVETLQQLLEATRAWAAFALRPTGNQVLLNVERVGDLARAYELGGGLSFRGFVERLNEEAAQPTSSQGPVVEEGAPGVRLMTVHAAKGLEFPVVVLADMTARLFRDNPEMHVDAERRLAALRLLGCAPEQLVENAELERERDRAEGVRVAYVAATRARDLLVVPAIGESPLDGWLQPLTAALYPARERRRASTAAPGCPRFGEWSVIPRAQDRPEVPASSVRPGLHRLGPEGPEVVWWDPEVLQDRPPESFGLRQEEVLAGGDEPLDHEGMAREERWRGERAGRIEAGRRRSREVVVVTELEEGPLGEPPRLSAAATERAPGRPAGPRFGTLVHTLLRDVPLEASDAEVERLAALHASLLRAPSEERDAAVVAVSRALAHPLFDRARAAAARGAALREPPFLLPLADGRLLEGTLDLAFEEDGRWVVVDYKTDAEVESRRAGYEIQLAWYLFALERLKGAPVEGVLLAV